MAPLFQMENDGLRALLWRGVASVNHQVGILRHLVGGGDAGELLDDARARALA